MTFNSGRITPCSPSAPPWTSASSTSPTRYPVTRQDGELNARGAAELRRMLGTHWTCSLGHICLLGTCAGSARGKHRGGSDPCCSLGPGCRDSNSPRTVFLPLISRSSQNAGWLRPQSYQACSLSPSMTQVCPRGTPPDCPPASPAAPAMNKGVWEESDPRLWRSRCPWPLCGQVPTLSTQTQHSIPFPGPLLPAPAPGPFPYPSFPHQNPALGS